MYLANKVQNIQGSADTLLDLAGIEQDEIRPVAEAMEQGGRLAAKAKVSDALLDKCKPIAGTPDDCIAAIEEYRDAGCTHVMLELWGENRHEQIRLFGEQVLPHVRGDRPDARRGAHADHPLLARRGGSAEDILLVDLRSGDERRAHGIIPGSVHVPRSVLEWRADPTSAYARTRLAGRARARLRAGLLVEPRRGDARRARRRRRRPRRRLRGLGGGRPPGDADRMKIDRDRLVDTASALVNVHSFTGDEERMADLMLEIFEGMGLQVQRQQVEDNRANALGTWAGAAAGRRSCSTGTWTPPTPDASPGSATCRGSSRRRSSGTGVSTGSGS